MDSGLKLFSRVLRLADNMNLPTALELMLAYSRSHPYVQYTEELENINESFKYMLHYMEAGTADPQRERMYADMLVKLKKVVRNMRADYRRRNVDFYKDAVAHMHHGMPMSENGIKMMLEDFVGDATMLQLEPEESRAAKEKELYTRHYSFMQSLFNYIVTSDLWTKEQADRFADIIISPTVDSNDAQLMVSAVMLAAMNNFDTNKFRILTEVYKSTADEKVRQKALVGWLFSMCDTEDFDIQQKLISELCMSDSCVRDIVDLQKQVLFCMNAEKDNDLIQRDIMPTLIKNSNISVSRFGITEKEDAPLQDILDPGAQDRAMEETEAKFQQMMNMQKSGADIYFGGFSQMKRFPFFYTLSNWFCPFSTNHPDLMAKTEKLRGNKFLDNLLANGPFCDSDKYSFALAMATVIDRLPPNISEMMGNSEALGPIAAMAETTSTAYMRRQILQDLYRFFRLYRWNEQIYNPFASDNCLFVLDKLFHGTGVEDGIEDIGYFLIKRHEGNLLGKIVEQLDMKQTVPALMLVGAYNLDYTADYEKAMLSFTGARNIDPDNEKAANGYAKAAMLSGNTDKARTAFARLYEMHPEKKSLAMDYCVTLAKCGDFETANKVAYRMSFDFPESQNVRRILAWVLMGNGNLKQADKEYQRLLASGTSVAVDYLNAGYCKWFAGEISEASDCFARFCELQKKTDGNKTDGNKDFAVLIDKEFNNDSMMLDRYSLTRTDRMLMRAITINKITE